MKIFRREDFAYHKVGVVFWQTDENDQPAIVTEPYEKSFTAANVVRELEFYCREPMLMPEKTQPFATQETAEVPQGFGLRQPSGAFGTAMAHAKRQRAAAVQDADALTLAELTFRVRVKAADGEKTITLTLTPKDNAAKKFKAALDDRPEILSVEWTHRHYVQDDEYIPHDEDIEAFLKREIAKPIIRWEDSPQLGYEILPNKYFYRYQPPTPAKDLLSTFWQLEKEAEGMLKGLAGNS